MLAPMLVYGLIAIVLTSSSPPGRDIKKKSVSALACDMFEMIDDYCLRGYYTTPT